MDSQTTFSLLAATIVSIPLLYRLFHVAASMCKRTSSQHPSSLANPSILAAALTQVLPQSVFFHPHPVFDHSINSYWSRQQRDIVPECVVRPNDDTEVSLAVTTIKDQYDRSIHDKTPPPAFAVRSGGHSTVPGASNTAGGVVIDLSSFKQVIPSEDGTFVVIGCGAKWADVSRTLDSKGLAVAGGRNSDVGVGGLTLGGGFSFFSPRVGFVCDNVLKYRVVLADGAVTTASETENRDLWRALKGGGNNFGVVTSFTIRSFPHSSVWSGFLYMFSSKAPQNLRAFHDFVDARFDEYAAGPLLCFSYVQQIGIQVIATQLIYTKPVKWPSCWLGFRKIGRLWSTNKVRSLTSATDELDKISPANFRQLHITTTILNDHPTLEFAHATYVKAIAALRQVKGMVWTLILQPLPISAMHNGTNNVLGLQDRKKSLVIVLFTAVWVRSSDDELVRGTVRAALKEINRFAGERGTADPFRYLNWCDETQNPFESYGAKNLSFLRDVSTAYDPDGLFQKGCRGGFKLDR